MIKKTKKLKKKVEELPIVELAATLPVVEGFKVGDVLEDLSSGKRFHYHNQSVVDSDPKRFKKV